MYEDWEKSANQPLCDVLHTLHCLHWTTCNIKAYQSIMIDWLIDLSFILTIPQTATMIVSREPLATCSIKGIYLTLSFLWNVYDTVCYLALYWDPTEEIIIFRIFAWKNLLSTLSLWCIQDNIFRINTLLYMYCICFTQNEDNGGHKICRGPAVSVLKQFIIYRRRGGNEGKIY